MIRITTIANSSAAKSYFKLSDYHLEDQELQAHWHGKGADRLNLHGPVEQSDFNQLCDNIHPNTGLKLTAKTQANRRVGYDLTFSVSKSVSIAYALGGDDRIVEAFREAVAETMTELEREIETRVRTWGRNENRTVGNLIWADFIHQTSRPIQGVPDPQLHCHAVAFNAVWDHEEQRWKAGEFSNVKANAQYFQAAFRVRLAGKLQELGYGIERKKDDFELKGILPETIKKFSRRTTLIEKLAEHLGITNPESKAKLGATTRERKPDHQPWPWLLQAWSDKLTNAEREAIRLTQLQAIEEPALWTEDNAAAVEWASRHVFERNSVVEQRKLITEALKHGIGSCTVDGVHAEMGNPQFIRTKYDGRLRVSTREVLAEEMKMVETATKGRGACKPLVEGRRVAFDSRLTSPAGCGTTTASPAYRLRPGLDATIPAGSSAAIPDLATLNAGQQAKGSILNQTEPALNQLNPGQRRAVEHIWHSQDRVMLIRGAAGVGKTTLLQVAVPGIESTGKHVIMLAPSAQASRGVLRTAGFQHADTLARFLHDEKFQEQARNQVVLLDEASLAGAKDMARLCQLADSHQFRLILLGDRRQHKSVSRGDTLALLEDHAGIKSVEVLDIRRQHGAYKEAVAALARGDIATGFQKLDDLGWIKEGDGLVDEYLAARKKGEEVLVVSPTHAQGEAVTAQLREALKREGCIHGKEIEVRRLVSLNLTEAEKTDPTRYDPAYVVRAIRSVGNLKTGQTLRVEELGIQNAAKHGSALEVFREDRLRLAPGDAVRVTAGIKDINGNRIDNGAMLTFLGTKEGHLRVKTAGNIERTLAANVGHLTHGYVSTSHAAQGKSPQRVLISANSDSFPAMDQAAFYVSASRGKLSVTVYTDDKKGLLEAAERERPRMLATELIRQPKRGIRHRLKRAVSFLRKVGQLAKEQWQEQVPYHAHHAETELHYER